MRFVRDERLVQAVRDDYESSKWFSHVEKIRSQLDFFNLYIWGSFVRNSLIRRIHEEAIEPGDMDLVVNDHIYPINMVRFGTRVGASFSKFGSPQWEAAPGIHIDLIPFSNAKDGDVFSIDEFLAKENITTNAIMYDPTFDVLYDDGAIKSINDRTLDVHYISTSNPVHSVGRAIYKALSLNYSFGDKIRESADNLEGLDEYLETYLPSKGITMGDFKKAL
ncbi:hypothetical protein GOV11_04000 [Candidatus Woesearchaeota archaeon]|nr:hypothetical protein [Candidatus Woesearchaeota archaeon]